MKFAIVINGTRGDVQPMLALAIGLMNKGHEIIFCAPPENEDLVTAYNCPFVPFGPNYKELFRKNAQMKGGATKSPSPAEMKKETAKQIIYLPEILKGSDIILGVGFVLGLHTVADMLKIPYRFVIFYPVLLGTSKTDPLVNRLLFSFGKSMTNMVMKSFINKKRSESGLEPISDVWSNWMGEHVIVACDKELNAAREGVSYKFTQTGYMFLPSPDKLPENIEKFIKAGKPPVYIGFGSNPLARPEKFIRLISEVAGITNQRLIVSKGWADLPEENTPQILYVDECPFEILFPHLSAVVYHGGTGTMAYAARAGIPQAAFPFMADQFENRKVIVKLRIGPTTCDFKNISVKEISNAVLECVGKEIYKKNAGILAAKLTQSDGVTSTINHLATAH